MTDLERGRLEGWRACRWEAARVALDHSSWMNPIGVRIKEAILALPDPPAPAAEPDARVAEIRERHRLAQTGGVTEDERRLIADITHLLSLLEAERAAREAAERRKRRALKRAGR